MTKAGFLKDAILFLLPRVILVGIMQVLLVAGMEILHSAAVFFSAEIAAWFCACPLSSDVSFNDALVDVAALDTVETLVAADPP